MLLAHDQVLEHVLQRLRATLATGRLDRLLQRLDRFLLALDQPGKRVGRLGVELDRGDVDRGFAAKGDDLFDQLAGAAEVFVTEPGQLPAERLRLQAPDSETIYYAEPFEAPEWRARWRA